MPNNKMGGQLVGKVGPRKLAKPVEKLAYPTEAHVDHISKGMCH